MVTCMHAWIIPLYGKHENLLHLSCSWDLSPQLQDLSIGLERGYQACNV